MGVGWGPLLHIVSLEQMLSLWQMAGRLQISFAFRLSPKKARVNKEAQLHSSSCGSLNTRPTWRLKFEPAVRGKRARVSKPQFYDP
jgi:hypothetical protein